MLTLRDSCFLLYSGGNGQFSDYWDADTANVPAHAGSIESLNGNRLEGNRRIDEN